ncbi:hypothetical protein AYO22_06203 [Fonsecaea multimorphosa]|nr:hypothetical protein AYO22_06203 [Fonsecaea multimorphosa]
MSSQAPGLKRRIGEDAVKTFEDGQDDLELEEDPALTALGYMPGIAHFNLSMPNSKYLETSLRREIESELAIQSQALAERYNKEAERLSRCFSPGKGGLTQIQQLFLTATWYKSEAKFVEAWHSLGAAIREAQEIGLHRDSLAKGVSSFELEMRRRTWCLLYMWDCSAIATPHARLEEPDDTLGPPSPFVQTKLLYEICLTMSSKEDRDPQDSKNMLAALEEVDCWQKAFPKPFSITEPDTSWDRDYPHLQLQREHLHTMCYRSKLSILKSILTGQEPRNLLPEMTSCLRVAAVDTCLKTMETGTRLFDLTFPAAAKAHIVTCTIFDTAAVMCAAIIHDRHEALPRRPEMLDSIYSALNMLKQLRGLTKTGAVCYGILSRLTYSLPMPIDGGRPPSKSSRSEVGPKAPSLTRGASSSSQAESDRSLPASDLEPAEKQPTAQSIVAEPNNDPADAIFDEFISFPTNSDFENPNFGGLEEVWDLQTLNLVASGPADAPALFQPLFD